MRNNLQPSFEPVAITVAPLDCEPPAESDRRDHERFVTIFRVAKVITANAEYLCVARNLSSGGMMLDVSTPFEIGEKVRISLAEDQNFEGQVVWQRAGTIGIAFTTRIDVERVLDRSIELKGLNRRRVHRIQVSRKARLQIGTLSLPVELCDLSQRGARIRTDHDFSYCGAFAIIVFGLDPINVTLRWCLDGFAGVEFTRTLPIAELMQWSDNAARGSATGSELS